MLLPYKTPFCGDNIFSGGAYYVFTVMPEDGEKVLGLIFKHLPSISIMFSLQERAAEDATGGNGPGSEGEGFLLQI